MSAWKIGVLALCLTLPAGMAQAEKPAWVRAESPHFIVYSNTGTELTRAYVVRLEQYRYILHNFYGQSAVDDGQLPKYEMYFLADRKTLNEVWHDVPDYVGGFYRPCVEGQAAFSIDQKDKLTQTRLVQDQPENVSQIIIFHEYAHQFMLQNTELMYPRWFIEGFAEYYGATLLQDDMAAVGVPSSERLGMLVEKEGMFSYQKPRMISYEAMLRNDPAVVDKTHIAQFYAQAWLLTHYMMATPERQAQLSAYIDAYNRGEDPVKAFEAATGLTMDALPGLLTRYVNKQMKAELFKVNGMPAPDITVADMPASARKLLLWEAAAKVCMVWDVDKARYLAEARKEAALYPADDYARTAIARIEISVGDEALALPYLKAYVAAHPDDALHLSLLGETYYLMTIHDKLAPEETKESQMKLARQNLMRAYRFDPLNATTLFYMSRAQQDLPDYPNDTAINAVMQARILVPSVWEYSHVATELLLRKERFDEAKTMLMPVVNNPHGGNAAVWAANIVAAIDAHKSKADILALYNTPIAADTPEKSEK